MMRCPICANTMTFLFEANQLHILKCTNSGCEFVGLDLETWESPYSVTDYYTQIKNEDVNPDRPLPGRQVARERSIAP